MSGTRWLGLAVIGLLAGGLLLGGLRLGGSAEPGDGASEGGKRLAELLPRLEAATDTASPPAAGDETMPAPATPAPVAGVPAAPAEPLVIRYRIEVRSPDPALADAPAIIEAILEDPRGWQQADIDFRLEPDAPHLIVIAEGAETQQLCQPYDVGGQFSCQNGPLVVLNAIRWREAVPHWPSSDVPSYRTMLVNHEVGHLLGMHHLRCQVPGSPAPVMEQQSGTLRGCEANPWPTTIELSLAATHQFLIAPPPLDVAFPQ